MTEAQDQDNDFFIDDIVDNAIVSNADAQFSFATDKLNTPSRARFFCELRDCFQNSSRYLPVQLSQSFCSRWSIDNLVSHPY